MQLHEVPAGCVVVPCRRCGDHMAMHPDDASPELARRITQDHDLLCPGPPPAPPDLACTMGGARHCHCAHDTGVCCWCGRDVETA